MTTATKITLSDKELELVCDTGWILTKHAIIQKVYDLFGAVLPQLQDSMNAARDHLTQEVFNVSPKISKGENYKLLPYVMLDYPRYFVKDDTIAIRTFFWWGNFFSVSLQLSGVFKTAAMNTLVQQYEWLREEAYFICVEDDPWEHHFETINFIPIRELTAEQFSGILLRKPFVKIAKKIPLDQWKDVPGFIVDTFTGLSNLVKSDQAPRR